MKRTLYSDNLISDLRAQLEAALVLRELPKTPRYRREWWNGRIDGLKSAIRLLEDRAGETEPCAVCGHPSKHTYRKFEDFPENVNCASCPDGLCALPEEGSMT